MKQKILLISLVLFASNLFAEQTVYYVSSTGDDMLNTGLSAESPFLSVKKVFDVEATTASTDILINVAGGTYPTSIITPNLKRTVKVTLAGQSASTAIIQNTSEFLNATTDNFRLFQLQPADNAGLELNIRDVTIQNYGGAINNYAGAIIMMNGQGTGIKVSFSRCIFKNNVAARAAILQSSNTSYEVSFDGCYFENCKSFDFGTNATNLEAIIYVTGGKISVKNCIFNNNTKDPLFGTTDRDLKKGSLITINPILGKITAVLVNNTFVNNKVLNGKDEAISIQPAITIADLSSPKKAFGVDLTMLNNLFVDNKRTGFEKDVDLYIDPVDVTQVAVTNNVFNKIATPDQSEAISILTNKVSTAYAVASAEIAFETEGDLPKIQLAENGVLYVSAKGTEIVGKGIANSDNSEVPVIDIRNITRKTTPDIGATDVLTSSVRTMNQMAGFKIFVNDGVLNIINENQTDYVVRITDITGRAVYTSSFTSGNFNKKIDLQGIGLVSIHDAQNSYTKKIIF